MAARTSDRLARRRAAVPAITYPPELPVSARRDDLLAAIRDHQVVVVAGETGSGKTTQLPKLCLELGRGIEGTIAHTQPRRLAARTVAERIADELGVPLGEAVGYAVRFTDRTREDTLVRLMTDGLLLAEIQRDRLLRRYDTIIVDEAHERSLNIDFLLGYLQRILPRAARPEGHHHLGDDRPRALRRALRRDAPVVEVSGPHVPGRGALPAARRRATATSSTRSATRSTSSLREGRGRRARVPQRRARDPRHRRRAARALRRRARGAAALRAAVDRRAAAHLPAAPRHARSCSRRTSPRRR